MRHKVLILGGGFAGLSAARALKKADADITLVDRRNFHLFQPLLYQVATGTLSPSDIAGPLRSIFSKQRNVRVLLGEARDIDAAKRVVTLADGTALEYDTLIVAAGSTTTYFGHDDWAPHAPCLKSMEDAVEMRHRIYFAFEKAELEGAEGQSPWLTFVIVGAGATGVELAGALSEIARKTLKDDFRSIHPEQSQLLIVDQAPRLLPAFSEHLAMKAEKQLLELGVRVRCGLRVTCIDSDGVKLERPDGTSFEIPSKTVLWAGGVAIPGIVKDLVHAADAPADRRGLVKVQPDLTVPNHPEIFVVGDIAFVEQEDGRGLPGVAQVAMQQGKYAGQTILRRLKAQGPLPPFQYSDRGDLAVIGRAAAVAKVFGHELWGFPAWFVWAFIHILYLIEFQSRIIVMIRWAFQYVTFSRGARLITGADHEKN
ncbi:MAG TPA: NAD(P)/FAD-dependent oxidoreductase [Bryobacteraceae bacterium]|jgi:NADH dehydrogenase